MNGYDGAPARKPRDDFRPGRRKVKRSRLASCAAGVGVLALTAVSAGCGTTSSSSAADTSTTASAAARTATAGGASGQPVFAYLQIDGSLSYFVLEAQGAKKEAAKLGASVKVENVGTSSATTISDIQQAIADHVNGLIVVAPSESLGSRMVSLADAAKVPIMASDNGFAGPNGKDVPFVGINAAQFGDSSGKILMSYYKKLGWSPSNTYMMLVTDPSLSTIKQRTGAEESQVVAAGFPKSQIIQVPTTDNTQPEAYSAAGAVKTAHPEAKHWLITGGNDDVAFGAAKALVASGVSPSDIAAVGLGGDLACTIWAKNAPNVGFLGTNYIYPNGIGADAVKELYNYVEDHKPFPANTYVAPIPLTKANLHSVDKSC